MITRIIKQKEWINVKIRKNLLMEQSLPNNYFHPKRSLQKPQFLKPNIEFLKTWVVGQT